MNAKRHKISGLHLRHQRRRNEVHAERARVALVEESLASAQCTRRDPFARALLLDARLHTRRAKRVAAAQRARRARGLVKVKRAERAGDERKGLLSRDVDWLARTRVERKRHCGLIG